MPSKPAARNNHRPLANSMVYPYQWLSRLNGLLGGQETVTYLARVPARAPINTRLEPQRSYPLVRDAGAASTNQSHQQKCYGSYRVGADERKCNRQAHDDILASSTHRVRVGDRRANHRYRRGRIGLSADTHARWTALFRRIALGCLDDFSGSGFVREPCPIFIA